MTEKELKRLTRADLLEMLIAQSEELRQVKERLKTAEAALANRVIEIDNAGSIAEASLRLNGVFEAAQAACEQYTENIRLLSERSQLVCRRMEEESREQAERLLEQTRRRCEEMEAQANAAGCEGNWQ
ncbi:MAG: hypothetical protein SPC78_02935 [Candidatus Faecousia sp.]|nr:hypothetical protein [Clostridiales bacterium]MCI6937718.1 hypothetical protein [Clostridiales bacterium]MDD5883135.1 DNA repair protein [Bacillota bacterium]MDY4598573.1 hypothetical protein [Candidatus Faecousia sp.]